jgi:hypothetical protein
MSLENTSNNTGGGLSALEKAKLLKEQKENERKDAEEKAQAEEDAKQQEVYGTLSQIDGRLSGLEAEKLEVEESIKSVRGQRFENINTQRNAVKELKSDEATAEILDDKDTKEEIFSEDEGKLEAIKEEEENLNTRLNQIQEEIASLKEKREETFLNTPEGQEEMKKEEEEERLKPITDELSEKLPEKESVLNFENKQGGLNKIVTEYINVSGDEIMKIKAEAENEDDFLDAVSRFVYDKFKDEDMKGWGNLGDGYSKQKLEINLKVSEVFNQEDFKQVIKPQIKLLEIKATDPEFYNLKNENYQIDQNQEIFAEEKGNLDKLKEEAEREFLRVAEAGISIEGIDSPDDLFNEEVVVGEYGDVKFPRISKAIQEAQNRFYQEKEALEAEISKKEKSLLKTGLGDLKNKLGELMKKETLLKKLNSGFEFREVITRRLDFKKAISLYKNVQLKNGQGEVYFYGKGLSLNDYQQELERRTLTPEQRVLSLKINEAHGDEYKSSKLISEKTKTKETEYYRSKQ